MLIILEGVDGAGKSSLAEKLISRIKDQYPGDSVEYIHSSQLNTDTFTAYCEPLEKYEAGKNTHIVIDRWHVGEQIYGPLYRGASKFTVETYRWTELFLATKGAVLWNVTQPLDVLEERLQQRGEDFLQTQDIAFVRNEFIKHTKDSMLYGGTATPDEDSIDDWARFITDDAAYAERRVLRMTKMNANYFGVTYSDPRTVLITSSKKATKGFDPLKSDEAAKFFKSLPADHAKSIGIIQTGSAKRLQDFAHGFPFTGFIVYDKNVMKKLDELGIDYTKIDKPTDDRMYFRHLDIQIEKAGEIK